MDIREQIQIWLDQAEEALIYRYNSMNLKASGNFERELNSNIAVSNGKYVAVINAPAYTGTLIHGRKAAMPPVDAIRQWIKDKNINVSDRESFAWAIAMKMKRDGIKVPNVRNDGTLVSGTFTQDRMNDLYKSINTVVIKDTTDKLKEIIKK